MEFVCKSRGDERWRERETCRVVSPARRVSRHRTCRASPLSASSTAPPQPDSFRWNHDHQHSTQLRRLSRSFHLNATETFTSVHSIVTYFAVGTAAKYCDQRVCLSDVAENLGGFSYGVYMPGEWLWIDSNVDVVKWRAHASMPASYIPK